MQVPTPVTAITKLEIPTPVALETKQDIKDPAASENTSATTSATATTSNDSSSPSAAKPTSAPIDGIQPATTTQTPPEKNMASPQIVESPVVESSKEPVNAFTENSKLWFQARKLFNMLQPPAPTELPLLAQWVIMTKQQVKDLTQLEKRIIQAAKENKFKKLLFGSSKDVQNPTDLFEANQMFDALMLLLAECDILSAKAAIQNHLTSPLDLKNKSEIETQIGEVNLPPVMEKWVDKIGSTRAPINSIQNTLYLKIRNLKDNTRFPIKQIEIPDSR